MCISDVCRALPSHPLILLFQYLLKRTNFEGPRAFVSILLFRPFLRFTYSSQRPSVQQTKFQGVIIITNSESRWCRKKRVPWCVSLWHSSGETVVGHGNSRSITGPVRWDSFSGMQVRFINVATVVRLYVVAVFFWNMMYWVSDFPRGNVQTLEQNSEFSDGSFC